MKKLILMKISHPLIQLFKPSPSSSPPQVMDIAKLMKAYISMIVKKRYSNCQSVSSHGSQSSAW